MLLEYYRAYVIAKLDPNGKMDTRSSHLLKVLDGHDNDSSVNLFQQFYDHISNCLNYLFSQ